MTRAAKGGIVMARKTGDYHTEHIEWLKDPENAAGYLNAVIEEEDKDALLLALRNIAEAEGGMAAVAEKAHLKRESLYRMLSPRGNPALSNLFSILHGMGLKMTIQPDKTVTVS
jgi:probable addiction module antidote protein